MKNTFLAGVAAAALLAGINVASAQGMTDRQPAAGGSQPAQMNKGGAELKGKAGADVKAESPGGKARAQAPDNMKGDTKGQAPDTKTQARDNMKSDTKAQDAQKQDDKAKDAQSKPESGKGGASAQSDSKASGSATAGQGAGGGGKAANLSAEQKTKIRQTVIKSGPRVTNVNFSLNVGTVVPRTVRYAPLPSVLVEVYPDWRGYYYFIVDEQIVIIEPSSFKIVTIITV